MPIACTLCPADIASRKDSLLPGLAARAERVTPTSDGYTFEFVITGK